MEDPAVRSIPIFEAGIAFKLNFEWRSKPGVA